MCLRAAKRPDSRRLIFTENKWRRTNVVLKWRGVQTESLIWYLKLTIIHINIDMFVEHYWIVKNRDFIPLKYVLFTVLYYCTLYTYCTVLLYNYCTVLLYTYCTVIPTIFSNFPHFLSYLSCVKQQRRKLSRQTLQPRTYQDFGVKKCSTGDSCHSVRLFACHCWH